MRAFVVGTSSCDVVADVPDLGRVFNSGKGIFDTKINSRHLYMQAGGSAINSRLAFQAVASALGHQALVYTCTKLGHDGVQNIAKEWLLKEIGNTGMEDDTLMDAAFGQTSYTIPTNIILLNEDGHPLEPHKGRGVIKGQQDTRADDTDTIRQEIKSAVKKSDIVILHSRYPALALHAAQEAAEQGVGILLDCAETNPEIAEELRPVLPLATWVTAPSDALAPGMKRADPEELFRQLRDEYGCQNIAISDNNNPIRIFSTGVESVMPVRKVNSVDILGAGDTRDSAMGVFLVEGDSFIEALAKGSDLASFSIEHYGRKWVSKLREYMRNNQLYRRHFEPHAEELRMAI